MKSLAAAISVCFLLLVSAANATCHTNGCLKALQSSSVSGSSFCTTYLATTSTATTGIPTSLSACKSESTKLSSACSCLLGRSASSSGTSATATSLPKTTPPSTPTTPVVSPKSTTSSSTSRATGSCSSVQVITQTSCTATSTKPASTITSVSVSTVTVVSTRAPSISASTVTITKIQTLPASVTTVTQTVTSTLAPLPSPSIVGGNFNLPGATLSGFTVTQNPPQTVFVDILAPSQEEFVIVPTGTNTFLFLNYELVPILTSFTLAQPLAIAAGTTSIMLQATLATQTPGGTVQFCISPTNCGPAQNIGVTDATAWATYEQQFTLTPGVAVTASVVISSANAPIFFVGVGSFSAF